MTDFIAIENLHYRPDSLPPDQPDILDGITIGIPEGQFVAIIGKNGSGKTTLIKHVNGLLSPTGGSVQINGLDTKNLKYRREIRSLVGMVFQNPADQIVASTLVEDVAFGLENLNIPTSEIRERVTDQLSSVGLGKDANRPPHLLSGGEMQKLALAGVLARRPKVILFDEPTSMLDPATRHSFLKRICALNQQGITVIYITHHMEEAVYADQVIVLQSGKLLASGTPTKIFNNQQLLREAGLDFPETIYLANHFRSLGWDIPKTILTPKEIMPLLPHYTGKLKPGKHTREEVHHQNIIEVKGLHYTYLEDTPFSKPALQGTSVNFASHQIHGLAGSNGSGKSTLLQHLNGILRPSQGQIIVDGLQVQDPETKLRDVIQKAGLVFQNPESQFFETYVGDEIAYGPKQFKMEDFRERVKQAMLMVGLDFEAFKDRRLETLSGGEKRKVALASTLVLDQPILLFDEPSAGMDPQARRDLMNLFFSLKEQGKTLIIATHQMEELAQISQSLSIMQSGKILKSGPSQDLFIENNLINQSGLSEPLAVSISRKLKSLGWPLDLQKNITSSALIGSLQELTS